MKRFFLFPVWAAFLALANAASAQAEPDCPSVFASGGVDIAAPADILHRPLAMPGAFGGNVACLLRPVPQGVEQLFVETLPFDGNISQGFQYLNNSILYTMRVGAPDAPPIESGRCYTLALSGFECYTDLALGKQVISSFAYTPGGKLKGASLQVRPGYGVVPPEAWQSLQMTDPTGPDLTLTAFLGTRSTPERLPLELQFDENTGSYYFAIYGQPAYEFMLAQNQENFDILVTIVADLTERTESGTRQTTNRYTYDIGSRSIAFLVMRLFQIRDLMSAGFEDSKALDFSN